MNLLSRLFPISLTFLFGLVVVWPLQAQEPKGSEPKEDLSREVADLRAQLTKLEAAMESRHEAHAAQSSDTHQSHRSKEGIAKGKGMGMQGMQMGMEGMEMGMSMMKKGMGMMGMGAMAPSSAETGMSMDGMKGSSSAQMMPMKGMRMMGRMPDASMQVSALPGFPGASHLYHIGSTGFFLDHGEHVGLSPKQQEELNRIKQAALLEQNEFDRRIEQAEEELWVLTGGGEPDATAIEKRLADIGVMTTQKRLNFIRAVGEAAGILTEEQRKTLTGHAAPENATSGSAHQHEP